MGVISGKDIFNSKFITAVIINSSNRSFFVPIKNVIGDYFVAPIENRLYVFRMNEEIITYRHTLVKSFRWYLYTTSHYLPMSPKRLKELEKILEKNDLPRLNIMLFNILKYLGRREKSKFQAHRIADLVTELSGHEDKYSEEIQNLLRYLDHLRIDEVVTPVKKITEFIEDDLMATDPGFLGTVLNFYKRTDIDHKKLNNEPIGTKKNWLKPIAFISLAVIGITLAYWLYTSGAIENFIGGFTNWTGGAFKSSGGTDWMASYTPESLKAAVDSGQVKMSSLPPDIQGLIKNVKVPPPPTDFSVNLSP